MQRKTSVDAGDGPNARSVDTGDDLNESADIRLTVDVAGRRLVYAESDLETIGFSTNELY
ncbi:hypothetical protein [Halorhabdus amylolytica]|uniref:hypothetical protein n=1 Tax=Halorhabdus amylolytica TaxID=2559573 RepID=UPI0010AACB2E|nr:hypothetical protein [Halorhabdus amylolytica]